jgi:hypothetical protein
MAQMIGYARVSTQAQSLDQQHDALTAAGITRTFTDTMSGARDDRAGLAEMLAYAREGDTVVVVAPGPSRPVAVRDHPHRGDPGRARHRHEVASGVHRHQRRRRPDAAGDLRLPCGV